MIVPQLVAGYSSWWLAERGREFWRPGERWYEMPSYSYLRLPVEPDLASIAA